MHERNMGDISQILVTLQSRLPVAVFNKFRLRLKTELRHCKDCGGDLPLTDFYLRVRGGSRVEVRPGCKPCHNRRTVQGQSTRPANGAFMRYRANARAKGQPFAIDLAFVQDTLQKSCHYCDDRSILITIDRMNNALGYSPENCVPCCIRCNLVKADMPHEAWFIVAKSMKEARISGLFGDWAGRKNFAAKHDVSA